MDTLQAGRLIVKLSWGAATAGGGGAPADLDLQAVCFGNDGRAVEAVYWNRLVSRDGAITHTSGDCADEYTGEEIAVDLSRIDPSIAAVVFTISSFKLSTPLRSVTDVMVAAEHVPTSTTGSGGATPFHTTAFPAFAADTTFVATTLGIARTGKAAWDVRQWPDGVALDGRWFAAALDGIRRTMGIAKPDEAAHDFTVPVALEKGGATPVMHLNGVVCAGVSWQRVAGAPESDIDLAVVAFDRDFHPRARVFWGMLAAYDGAIEHDGDVTEGGAGTGHDDEVVTLRLGQLGANVAHIAFVVSNNDEGTLAGIANIAFRIFAPATPGVSDSVEYARVDNVGSGGEAGAMSPAVLTRAADGWRLVSTSEPLPRASIMDAMTTERLAAVCSQAVRGGVEPACMRDATRGSKEAAPVRPASAAPRPAAAGTKAASPKTPAPAADPCTPLVRPAAAAATPAATTSTQATNEAPSWGRIVFFVVVAAVLYRVML